MLKVIRCKSAIGDIIFRFVHLKIGSEHLQPYMGKWQLLGTFRHIWISANAGQRDQSLTLSQNPVKLTLYMERAMVNSPYIGVTNLLNPNLK